MVSPKPMKGQALGPMKRREERKSPAYPESENQRESSERIGPESLEVVKGSESSGHAAQLKWD